MGIKFDLFSAPAVLHIMAGISPYPSGLTLIDAFAYRHLYFFGSSREFVSISGMHYNFKKPHSTGINHNIGIVTESLCLTASGLRFG